MELSKLGAWSSWSRGAVVGAGVGPTRDLGKHLYFFSRLFVFFVLFVLLYYVFTVEETKKRRRRQQRKEEGDDSRQLLLVVLLLCNIIFFFSCFATQSSEEGKGSNAVAFFLFFLCCAIRCKEEGDGSKAVNTFSIFLRCAKKKGTTVKLHSITKKVITIAFFLFFFCSREKKATMGAPSFLFIVA